jgi:hypothetical protein
MLKISARELAELLSGIARAQAAVIHGVESAHPGTRGNHVVPAIQNAAHLRDHPDPTLTDLPVRVLLSYMGRAGPDPAAIARDLERLVTGADAPAAAAPETAAAEPAASTGQSLDFSEPAKPA